MKSVFINLSTALSQFLGSPVNTSQEPTHFNYRVCSFYLYEVKTFVKIPWNGEHGQNIQMHVNICPEAMLQTPSVHVVSLLKWLSAEMIVERA